jgi:SAM-dependent methyltransferase
MLRTTPTTCLLCHARTDERVLAGRAIRDLPENSVFGGQLRIVECRACGLRYLNPAPDVRDLGHIYNYDVYEDSTNNNPSLMEHFYQKLVAHRPALHRVMEIGCGTGEFLALLESRGLETAGVEFADSSTRVKFKGKLYVGRMEDIDVPPSSFDAVLLLNVIEHLSDPVAVLHKIRTMLRPGGILLLRHPNSDLFYFPPYRYTVEFAKYLAHRWLHGRGRKTRFTLLGFQNQHLFYLNRRLSERMLAQAGFDVVHFSTADPYNRSRIGKALRSGRVIEAGIAGVRHLLSVAGLGPECLIVARARPQA